MAYDPETTFYVRLSLMKPKTGQEQAVLDMHTNMLEWLPGQPGWIRGYLIVDGDPQGRVGHFHVWNSEADAERAAQSQHVLSVRSELLLLVEEDSHAEHSYLAHDPQIAAS